MKIINGKEYYQWNEKLPELLEGNEWVVDFGGKRSEQHGIIQIPISPWTTLEDFFMKPSELTVNEIARIVAGPSGRWVNSYIAFWRAIDELRSKLTADSIYFSAMQAVCNERNQQGCIL